MMVRHVILIAGGENVLACRLLFWKNVTDPFSRTHIHSLTSNITLQSERKKKFYRAGTSVASDAAVAWSDVRHSKRCLSPHDAQNERQ